MCYDALIQPFRGIGRSADVDRGRAKTAFLVEDCTLRPCEFWGASKKRDDQAAIASIKGLTPRIRIIRFML